MNRKKNHIPNTDFLSKKIWIDEFFDLDISLFEKELRTKSEEFWVELGQKKALKIFHAAAERVPAYKDFLKSRKIDHKKVKTIDDFNTIPATDKKNYMNIYPLAERCWDGDLLGARIIATSSGTSGEPTFWPRSDYQEYEQNILHELLFKYSFNIEKKKTLILIGFPMGIYVSGLATAIPTLISLSKKYKATFLTPGNNKIEFLKIIKNLWSEFDQIVLVGHPFFIKDVIESGKKDGFDWSKTNIKAMFCSEGFNETWREYLTREAGIKNKPYQLISTYGSSEALLSAIETPLSIFTRKLMDKNKKIKQQLTSSEFVPNIFQYNPLLQYIEAVNGELVFTTAGYVPLIRFNMHDAGEILPFQKVKKTLGEKIKILKSRDKQAVWNLPFVSLFGRSDNTIIFYAANIYPEHIRLALDHDPFLHKITGRFTMRKVVRDDMEQCLEIHIELKPNTHAHDGFEYEIREVITERLKEINREYLDTIKHSEKDLRPVIVLWPNGHEKYFKPGLKPKYIVKD